MTFEEWINTDSNYVLVDIKDNAEEIWTAAWNEAIRQAANKVRENYDEQEPWLEAEEIEALGI